jgi:hypothetical protein
VDEDFKFISFAGAFDPETVNILGNAFERAWQKTETSGYRFARPGYAHMMRRVMVKHILNLAECGERDEIKLSDGAFHFFTTNYKV